ncbi:GAF domain-containing sensor histidine kinase [Alkalitalea saponilacus]|uniref:histidine kinase n=1 Tax=Alkalitalea saponilacus TaxID=889453 RepID=A0A1T5FBG0_9BACT|nr:GAF domain-containing sensor histidine kinase [Alkalitalea saponilacus]ASB50085.1 hypothetical protein CDL62_13530 [Alkalitalea saponilacus]SKB93482.1 Signal transduction histidine kinase [Alkalitalea saponilacus]
MATKYSKVKVRGENELKQVVIGTLKPKIVKVITNKWQALIDTAANICNVPSGLITQLKEEHLEVFLNSSNEDNPIKATDTFELGFGHYCEKVIGSQKELVIHNASQDPVWRNEDPEVKVEMISYLGVPLNWPDGEVFGTVCLLDNKENSFNSNFISLVRQLKQHIETDLKLLIANYELKAKNKNIENLNQINNKFISIISHDVRGSISSIEQLLNIMLCNYAAYNEVRMKQFLKSISRTSSSVLLTLENLLSWKKIDLLELKTNKTHFNIVKTITDLLVYFNLSIALKKLKVTESYESKGIMVYADQEMICTSLRNILSNAIKFTKSEKEIYIRVYNNNNLIVVEIEDTGIGMSQNQIENLFKYKISHQQTGTEGEKSTGIGLLLVKEFLIKNDVQLSVESIINVGTKFKLNFTTNKPMN